MPTNIPKSDNEPIAGHATEITLWLDTIRKRSPVARVELVKVGYAETVMTWTLEGTTEGAPELALIADEITRLAEQEGRTSASASGKCIFRLRAVDGQGTQFAQKTFGVASAPAGGGGLEAPTDLGSAFGGVLRAYNELTMIVTRAFAGRDEAWQRQNELLLAQNVELRKEHFSVLKQWQSNILLEHEQRRLSATLAREERRDQELFNQVNTLFPIIANRLGGGGPGKGAPAAQAMLDGVFSQFTSEQVEALTGPGSPLNDQQKWLLGELFMSYTKRTLTPLNGAEVVEAPPPAASNGQNGKPS
jgi:hypothetical protein